MGMGFEETWNKECLGKKSCFIDVSKHSAFFNPFPFTNTPNNIMERDREECFHDNSDFFV